MWSLALLVLPRPVVNAGNAGFPRAGRGVSDMQLQLDLLGTVPGKVSWERSWQSSLDVCFQWLSMSSLTKTVPS